MVTLNPLLFSNRPKEAAVMPLPNDETTPPVTKIYFVIFFLPRYSHDASTPLIYQNTITTFFPVPRCPKYQVHASEHGSQL